MIKMIKECQNNVNNAQTKKAQIKLELDRNLKKQKAAAENLQRLKIESENFAAEEKKIE